MLTFDIMSSLKTIPTGVLILASLLCRTSEAQVVFGNHYDVGFNSVSWVRGVATTNGGLMVSARPVGDSVNEAGGSILTTDNDGNVMSLLRYQYGGSDMITCMEGTSDGGVMVGADGSGNSDLLIRKLQMDGDVDWAKSYTVNGADHSNLYDLVQLAPDVFIGMGTYCLTSGACKSLLFKFTGQGDVVWAREYAGQPGTHLRFNALTADPNGGVIVTGLYVDIPTESNMLVMHADMEGNINWTRWYSDALNNEGATTLLRPDGGFAVLGGSSGDGEYRGVVIRTGPDGAPVSAISWGMDIGAGHCFSDGSMMLMSPSYDARTAFARIDADNNILWSTQFSATSWGELVPIQLPTLEPSEEAMRFAYVSSEMFSDVTINTLTAQCEACNTEPVPFTEVTERWVESGMVDLFAIPATMTSTDLVMTPIMLDAVMAPQCMLNVGVDEHRRAVETDMKCGYDPVGHALSVTGLSSKTVSVTVSDMLGRQWASLGQGALVTDDLSMRVRLPENLAPGYYVARVGSGQPGCAFIVADQVQ